MDLMNRLAWRLRLVVSRAVVTLVNDAAKMQALQVQLQPDVVRDRVEHFQNYGFTSVPLKGSEGLALAVGASTAHTVVINVDDRRYRLKGLQSGEVALYDDIGHRVHLTRDGIVIDGKAHPVKLVNLTKLRVEADIEATGQIKDLCDGAGTTMAHIREVHDGHTHNTSSPGSPTAVPNPPLMNG